MKKPLISTAVGISLLGCLLLGTCAYYAFVFGNGNFNQVTYITKVDPTTKTVERDWVELPTTERGGSNFINMWLIGAMLLIAGPAIVALDYALRDNRNF